MVLNNLTKRSKQSLPLSLLFTSFTSLLSRQILLLRSHIFLLIVPCGYSLVTSCYFLLLLITHSFHVLALPKNENLCRVALSHTKNFYCKYTFTLSLDYFFILMYQLNCTKIYKNFTPFSSCRNDA